MAEIADGGGGGGSSAPSIAPMSRTDLQQLIEQHTTGGGNRIHANNVIPLSSPIPAQQSAPSTSAQIIALGHDAPVTQNNTARGGGDRDNSKQGTNITIAPPPPPSILADVEEYFANQLGGQVGYEAQNSFGGNDPFAVTYPSPNQPWPEHPWDDSLIYAPQALPDWFNYNELVELVGEYGALSIATRMRHDPRFVIGQMEWGASPAEVLDNRFEWFDLAGISDEESEAINEFFAPIVGKSTNTAEHLCDLGLSVPGVCSFSDQFLQQEEAVEEELVVEECSISDLDKPLEEIYQEWIETLTCPPETVSFGDRYCLPADYDENITPLEWALMDRRTAWEIWHNPFTEKVFVVGGRLEGSGSTGGLIGLDVNLEGQIAPLIGQGGWFLNIGVETNLFLLPNGNIGAGVVLGGVAWPENPGDTVYTITVGGTLDPGLGLEGDVQVATDGSGSIAYLGFSASTPMPTAPGYVGYGASIYLGKSPWPGDWPPEVWDAISAVGDNLVSPLLNNEEPDILRDSQD